ncbi:MAG TPA: gluconate 2-dehydrogenase subunit 3 family protein [Steroidobacteraceae bacterium]|jgi:gluconate 2-dehydrogenase gamma chain|nr:gluconate 2-dehydrogenase subunit 3 family protein [Steroidobacteraceae bacterium]
MREYRLSRRDALRGMGAITAAVAFDWPAIAQAAHEAHAAARAAAQSGAPLTYTLLGAADAADVEALTSQIIPSDDTPGAREAGVTFFIDRALGSFFAHWRPGFMEGLAGFQAAVRAADPQAASFAALTPEQQIDFLHGVERTPFFEQARLLTCCGMFSDPSYGGNRDLVGWRLLGFEDQHTFEPPFGYYDR